jgi:hypothetical protein
MTRGNGFIGFNGNGLIRPAPVHDSDRHAL